MKSNPELIYAQQNTAVIFASRRAGFAHTLGEKWESDERCCAHARQRALILQQLGLLCTVLGSLRVERQGHGESL